MSIAEMRARDKTNARMLGVSIDDRSAFIELEALIADDRFDMIAARCEDSSDFARVVLSVGGSCEAAEYALIVQRRQDGGWIRDISDGDLIFALSIQQAKSIARSAEARAACMAALSD